MTIIVSCAGDSNLAKNLYDYMATAHFKGSNNGFATDSVGDYVSLNSDEIEIPGEATVPRIKAVQSVVADYLDSNPGLSDYSLTTFEHVLMISKLIGLEKVVLSCEMCGFVALHDEELRVHRTSHGIL